MAIQLGREKISLPFLRAQLAARKAINSLMAYRAPKLGNVFVDVATKFSGIEAQILIDQFCFICQRDLLSFQNTLIGSSGGIILPNNLVANVLLGGELQTRIEHAWRRTPCY